MVLDLELCSREKSMSNSQKTNFNKGDIIFVEGETSKHLYIIKKGEVRIVKESQGRLIPITILEEKDFLGELSIFSEQPRMATAIAIAETELVAIQRNEIKSILSTLPPWINDLMHTLSDRLNALDEMIKEHKIIDEDLTEGNRFEHGEEHMILAKIKEYKA
jgi:CRP-like cAMP-binding protein